MSVAAPGERTVYLVRHAVAKSRSNWKGADEVRPLTKKGERQARGLVDVLAAGDVRRIVSSPTARCVDTVAPAAAKLGVTVEPADELLEGTPLDKPYELLHELARGDGDSVLCTHGDVVIELIEALKGDGVPFHGRLRWAKGSTWAITVNGGRPQRARYVAPQER